MISFAFVYDGMKVFTDHTAISMCAKNDVTVFRINDVFINNLNRFYIKVSPECFRLERTFQFVFTSLISILTTPRNCSKNTLQVFACSYTFYFTLFMTSDYIAR